MDWNFQEWLIVALFATLFFKEEAKTLVLHYFGIKKPEENLQSGMDYLKLHFNDELSHILADIQIAQKEGIRKITDNQDILKKGVDSTNVKLNEFERYGIKMRS